MYYHIYVEFNFNGRRDDCFESDIQSLDEVKNKFVKPYFYRKTFFVKGRVLKADTISIFRILESEIPLNEIVERHNATIPSSIIMFYNECDILKGATEGLKDVTFDLYQEFEKIPA